MLCSLSVNGDIQDLRSLCGCLESHEYEWFHEMVGQILDNKKGGPILLDWLEKWAKKARYVFTLQVHCCINFLLDVDSRRPQLREGGMVVNMYLLQCDPF